jgi:hypothetical protein
MMDDRKKEYRTKDHSITCLIHALFHGAFVFFDTRI